jgi:transcriptional regulator with XRE-family HTH domain
MSMIDATARGWAMRLEDAERKRSGCTLPAARGAVAARLGVAPGTLENIRRGRTKGVRASIFERLCLAVADDIQGEIARLEHDLQVARQCVAGTRDGEIREMDSRRERLLAVIDDKVMR